MTSNTVNVPKKLMLIIKVLGQLQRMLTVLSKTKRLNFKVVITNFIKQHGSVTNKSFNPYFNFDNLEPKYTITEWLYFTEKKHPGKVFVAVIHYKEHETGKLTGILKVRPVYVRTDEGKVIDWYLAIEKEHEFIIDVMIRLMTILKLNSESMANKK